MSYFKSLYVLLFLPAVALVYNIMPKKVRPMVLLLASFGYFFWISSKLIIFLLLSIISVYFAARLMSYVDKKRDIVLETANKDDKKSIKGKYKRRKKIIFILVILFNLSFLFFFKYLNFFGSNANVLLGWFGSDFHFKISKIIAPIGISYYTLQALSYVIDVYQEKIQADRNVLRVSLFLSFFPQIMEGPIARYSDTAESLYNRNRVTYDSFCFGYQRILYGLFKKYVIADRLNILVSLVFENYLEQSGFTILLGAAAYTALLYMEFSGTMDVVIGSGEEFHVTIPENFKQPFFAKNISEFWTRWHISLGRWFKDYIFYPISLSKPMKKLTVSARKKLGNHLGPLISGAVALFAVWSLNGLWHGAGWTFLFYGLYQFTLILTGNLCEPLVRLICEKLKINRQAKWYRIFQSLKMTFFVFIGELIFRAPTLTVAFGMLKKIFTNFRLSVLTNGELLNLGLDMEDFLILIISLIFIFIISFLREKDVNIREKIKGKNIFIRWCLYYALIFAILIFGAYGPGYIPVEPIYADF